MSKNHDRDMMWQNIIARVTAMPSNHRQIQMVDRFYRSNLGYSYIQGH